MSDNVFADICKLLTAVLFKSEKSPILLLHVPKYEGITLPPPGTTAFLIDNSHVKLLVCSFVKSPVASVMTDETLTCLFGV